MGLKAKIVKPEEAYTLGRTLYCQHTLSSDYWCEKPPKDSVRIAIVSDDGIVCCMADVVVRLRDIKINNGEPQSVLEVIMMESEYTDSGYGTLLIKYLFDGIDSYLKLSNVVEVCGTVKGDSLDFWSKLGAVFIADTSKSFSGEAVSKEINFRLYAPE